jgi:hypothetical protein
MRDGAGRVKTFRINARNIRRADPDEVPTRIGEIVMLNGGSPWVLVVDIAGDTCTVATKDGEYVLPCACLRRVPK